MGVYTDKRTGNLFIQFQLRGETYKERLGPKIKRKEAEALEIKIRSQLLFESHGISERNDHTFERFVKDYYLPFVEANHSKDSFEKSINVCRIAMPMFSNRQMRSIKPVELERFKTIRTNAPTMHGTLRKPATVLRELSILSRIFSLAVLNDVCDYNPCSRVEKPKFDNVMDKVLRREDEQKFFANMHSEWAKDICKLVLHTGLRRNDLMRLTRFDVDRPARLIRLVQGKTKRRVIIPLNDVAMEILERRWSLKSDLLFPSPVTGKETGSVTHAMRRACVRAEITVLTIRDLRRTYATRLDHFDAVTISRMLGHADLRSVHRYQRSLDKMREAAESLDVKQPTSMPLGLARIK